jgi:hypothetical protein
MVLCETGDTLQWAQYDEYLANSGQAVEAISSVEMTREEGAELLAKLKKQASLRYKKGSGPRKSGWASRK